jgi:hypothetical protein
MMLTGTPAFAQAELEYRQQRIKTDFAARTARPGGVVRRKAGRRTRLAGLLTPWRRPNLAPRRPMPAPHHLTSGT